MTREQDIEDIRADYEEEPALEQVYIDYIYLGGGKGRKSPAVTFTYNALCTVMEREGWEMTDIVAAMEKIGVYAEAAGTSGKEALAAWKSLTA